jgi:hypothetical protein
MAVLALTALVGCSPDRPVASPLLTNGTSATASPGAAPTITKDQAAALLTAARLEPGALTSIGGGSTPIESEVTLREPSGACATRREPRAVIAGQTTRWSVDTEVATEQVAVYQHPDAPVVLADSRSGSRNCYERTDLGSGVLDHHEEITLPKNPGVADIIGLCDRFTFAASKTVIYDCHAQMAHIGGYVVVDVSFQSLSLVRAKANVATMAQLASDKLGKLPPS